MIVKVSFEDQYKVIDDTQIRNIKILMLKGEKGDPGAGGASDWGEIGGTLSNQTDLQAALDAKANAADVYTETEVDSLLANKQNTLTFDTTPTASSTNPVTSGGIKNALDAKANASDVYTKTQADSLLEGKQDTLTFDTTPTAASTNPVTSGGVKSALDDKADSSDVYTKTQTDNLLAGKQGTLTFDSTPTASSTNPVTSGGVKSALDDKADSSNVYTKSQVDGLLAGVADLLYPVGSIYLSVNNVNPGTLFGGTWVAFGSGKTLVGVDTNDTDFNTVEATGGEKAHTLTENELPNITGDIQTMTSLNTFRGGIIYDAHGPFSPHADPAITYSGRPVDSTPDTAYNIVDFDIGGDQPHNNLQPYITCYMWKRTA